MKVSQLAAHAGARLKRPGAWGAVLLFGMLWNALRLLAGPDHLPTGELLLPFVLGALLMGLAASPWQWTGDDRPLAPFPRGLLQAIPWNVLLIVLLLPLLAGHPGRGYSRGGASMSFLPAVSPRLLALLAASGAFSLLVGWIWADRDQEAQKAEAQARLAREAQSRALQAQMNPHVLFNTLGGLAELAHEDAAATEAALVTLAGLLRRLLDHSARTQVPLGEERSLVEGFLALERFRLGARLAVNWTWDERLEDVEVPPLLLQPLVENALKHGIVPSREGGLLEIGLAGTPERLRLWVSNTGKPLEDPTGSGQGLANLRQRLLLMDACQAHLDLRTEGGRTVAELILEPHHA